MPKLLSYYKLIDIVIFTLITLVGLYYHEVTLFYLIYLFWMQELVRTITEFFISLKYNKENNYFFQEAFGAFFLLFVYLVFIVVVFGIMLNWEQKQLIYENIKVVLFRNLFFNITILLFFVNFCYKIMKSDVTKVQIKVFNPRHIVLHISIIFGAVLQMIVAKKLQLDSQQSAVLVSLPFMILNAFTR